MGNTKKNFRNSKMGDPSAGNQWDTVTFSKRPSGGAPVKAAKNSRGATEAAAKFDRSTSDKNRKLDEADEAGRIEKVSLDLSKKIMQARMAKKMTQVGLATLPHNL